MASRAELAAEAKEKHLGALRLQEKFNCVALSPPLTLAPCTPEERGKALEEKTTNHAARIRENSGKEFRNPSYA